MSSLSSSSTSTTTSAAAARSTKRQRRRTYHALIDTAASHDDDWFQRAFPAFRRFQRRPALRDEEVDVDLRYVHSARMSEAQHEAVFRMTKANMQQLSITQHSHSHSHYSSATSSSPQWRPHLTQPRPPPPPPPLLAATTRATRRVGPGATKVSAGAPPSSPTPHSAPPTHRRASHLSAVCREARRADRCRRPLSPRHSSLPCTFFSPSPPRRLPAPPLLA